MPRYLVTDNFPAAVAGADPLHPRFTRGFLEYARHRGLITDPARACRPRDKPRVERSVPYVRERFFKGAAFRDLAEMRSAARRGCLEVAGQRIHGTTRRRPLEVFEEEERPLLAPWDGEPYEVPDWRTATVHADHHVACQCQRTSGGWSDPIRGGAGRRARRSYRRSDCRTVRSHGDSSRTCPSLLGRAVFGRAL